MGSVLSYYSCSYTRDRISFDGRQLLINGEPTSLKLLGEYSGHDSGKVMNGAQLVEETFADGRTHNTLFDMDRTPISMKPVVVPEGMRELCTRWLHE